jgi:hypothetical protein
VPDRRFYSPLGSLGSLVLRLPEGYSDRSWRWTGVRSVNGRSRGRSLHRPAGSERWRGRALSAYGAGDDFNNNVSRTLQVFRTSKTITRASNKPGAECGLTAWTAADERYYNIIIACSR